MSGLCYWCESRGIMQCRDCSRNFCKFCIKNGHSTDGSQRLCFICGCFEIESNLREGDDGGNTVGLRDREMQDMLHRYEELCSNDKLANSIHDLLINIDALRADNLSAFFELMKSNIVSMLHDVQKVETMLNRAVVDNRAMDVDGVLMPLLKVVTKHHVFKRLGRPQTFANSTDIGVPRPNGVDKSVDSGDMSDREPNEFIDLTDDDDHRMDESRASGPPTSDDSDNERMQRSPLCLADEEKSTTKFEISEECGELADVSASGAAELPPSIDLSPAKDSPAAVFHTPPKAVEEKPPAANNSKRRRTRQSTECERLGVRLRSETVSLNSNLSEPTAGAFLPDLSESPTVFTRGVDSPLLRSDSRKLNQQQLSTISTVSSPTKKKPMINLKQEMLVDSAPTNRSLANRSSSSSDCNASAGENLHKFAKIVQRNKNSHLVCAAPLGYEKPFLLKEARPADAIDDIRPPVSNKTWSWERQIPAAIVVKPKTLSNGDSSAAPTVIAGKPIVIPKSIGIDPLNVVATVRSRSQTQPSQPQQPLVNKRSSMSISLVDPDEPKKKRGRPRKYFTNYTPEFELSWSANTSLDESAVANRSSSADVSDGK